MEWLSENEDSANVGLLHLFRFLAGKKSQPGTVRRVGQEYYLKLASYIPCSSFLAALAITFKYSLKNLSE